ncbi:MAG TPA: endolytic transglycosylase MltG [Thermoanaerobaculia bacterium]|nr:endolytic transglycosylase MltG [Thermoanaerobaculia bacterium]
MKRLLVTLAAVALLAAAGAAAWGWWAVTTPYRGYPQAERRLDVASGSSVGRILARLEAEGVIRNALLARLWLAWRGDPPLQAGEYRFTGALSLPAVLDKLVRGDVVHHQVTLVEGLTLEEKAAVLAAAGFGDRGLLLAAMRQPEPVADLDPAAEDLEGYLFPNTYRFPRGVTEDQIVATLVATFRKHWRQAVEPLLAPGSQRTVREVVTLASIVEKEARIAAERPLIAGVYANRLERGIALYADPTVIFALKKEGRWDGNIRRQDLAIDSPYNTYRYAGLPPGPIASPGLASLLAAAEPADVPYLYFVSRNDGSHVFSTTLAEHNRNVARWQKRYWRDRARERQGKADAGAGAGADADGRRLP